MSPACFPPCMSPACSPGLSNPPPPQGNCLGVDPSTGAGCSTKESVEKEFPEGWTIMKQGPNWMIKAPKSGAIYRSIRAARESLALIQRFFGQHREGKLDRNELDASTDRESDSTPTLRALYCRISGGKKGSGGQPGKHGKDGNNWMIRDELLDAIMLLPVLPSSSRSSSSIDDNTPASPPPKRRKKIDDDNRKRMDWSFDACLDAFGPEEIEGQEAIRIDLDEEEEEGGAKKASGRTTWRTCGVVGCEYWTKNESNLKGHIAVMHATNVLYLFCDCEGCEYKTKNEKNLKQHRVDVHAIHETNWVFCDYEGCEFRAKSNGRITQHKARKHNIDVKWHHCTECEFKAKTTGHITNHKASIHNIGVKWHQCTHCDHKTKLSSNLTIHMAGVHNIGVKWHHCPDCDYKAKQIGNLKVHIKSKHTTTT